MDSTAGIASMTDSGNAGRRLEPDFARHALALLNAGNAAQAEQIAREGTTWFPWYATGHHVHSRSLELLGQREDAFTAAQIALKLLPDSIFLRSEVERLALPVFPRLNRPTSSRTPPIRLRKQSRMHENPNLSRMNHTGTMGYYGRSARPSLKSMYGKAS